MEDKRYVTGLTPSNVITIGNYIGVLKNLLSIQENPDNEIFLFVADLHALTIPNLTAKQLSNNTLTALKIYWACGLNKTNTRLFIQSEVIEHTKLAWLFTCLTNMGELKRMTQFKDKSLLHTNANNTTTIGVGLFAYPTLMAADILLYKPRWVPIGKDQKQHVELAETLRKRFNHQYGEHFPEFHYLFNEYGVKIRSLVDPEKKMSKSDSNPNAFISLLDNPDLAYSKIIKAKTDSLNSVNYDWNNQPGITNLIEIYMSFSSLSKEDIIEKYKNIENYKVFKEDLGNLIKNFLIDIQKKYYSIDNDPNFQEKISSNLNYVKEIACKNMDEISSIVGIK